MTDHYQALSVPRGADAETIKAAFRRAARQAHPDRKGGSHERMQMVNRANEVLGDPVRKAHYDATGADQLPPSIDLEAKNMLLNVLTQVMQQDGDWVSLAERALGEHQAMKAPQVKAQINARIAMLRKRSGKFKSKTDENLVQGLIDQQVRDLEATLLKIDHELKVVERARELLKSYESEPEPTMFVQLWSTGTATTTGGWR